MASKEGGARGLGLLGVKLRRARIRRGLTQRELARLSGIPGSHISRIENGHRLPSLETLERLTGALQVRLSDLLYEADAYGSSPANLHQAVAQIIARARKRGNVDEQFLMGLTAVLPRLTELDRGLILSVAKKMAASKESKLQSSG